jgi:hypothetical protein
LATTLPLVAVMFGAVSHAHAQKRNPSEVPSAPVVQLIVKESGAIRSAAAINGGGDEMTHPAVVGSGAATVDIQTGHERRRAHTSVEHAADGK